MLSKYFFYYLCSAIIVNLSSTYSEKINNCTLLLSNKNEFENELIDYIDENSMTLIIEYMLDFSGVGHNFDFANRTNPDAFQPFRWYRAKGIAVERLLTFKQSSYLLFRPLFVKTFTKFTVNIISTPGGCLNNIPREEMEPFIAKFLLDDFGVNVDELRTTKKLYKDAEICTVHLEFNLSSPTAEVKYWCCRYDLHNQMTCSSKDFGSSIYIVQILLAVLFTILYLYSPMLYPKSSIPRTIIYKLPKNTLETHFKIGHVEKSTKNRICFKMLKFSGILFILKKFNKNSYEEKEDHLTFDVRSATCLRSFRQTLTQLDDDRNYTAKIKKVHLIENESSYIQEDKKTITGLLSFLSFFLSGSNTSDLLSSASKRNIMFLFFNTLPSILFPIILFTDSDEKDLTKAYVDRGLFDASYVNSFAYYLFPIIPFVFQFVCILVYLFKLNDKIFDKLLFQLPKKMKNSWQFSFDFMKELCKEGFCCILFTPIILLLFVLTSSPIFLLVKLSLKYSKWRTLKVMFWFLFLSFVFLPAIILSQIFMVLVALVMFQTEIIYPILSGLVAFVINLRLFLRTIGKNHDKCLKKIIHLVNTNTQKASSVNNIHGNNEQQTSLSEGKQETGLKLFLSNLHTNNPHIEYRKNCSYLKMEKSPAYIYENGIKKIKKSVIVHCMRHQYIEALYVFLGITVFMSAVVFVVIVLGRFDYINTSNQVFITLVTGVIPSFVMIATGSKDESSEKKEKKKQDVRPSDKELEEIKSKLESYTEEYLIDDIIIEQISLQELQHADNIVTFIRDKPLNDVRICTSFRDLLPGSEGERQPILQRV